MYSFHILAIAAVGLCLALRKGTAVPTLQFVISNNNVAVLGDNSITLTCTARKADARAINVVKLEKRNSDETDFLTFANFFVPGGEEASLVKGSDLYNRSAFILPENEDEMVVGIIMQRILCSDKGDYRCRLLYTTTDYETPSLSVDQTMKLEVAASEVSGSPVMDPSIDVQENGTVTFTCTGIVGNPAGNIIWERRREGDITSTRLREGITNTHQSVDCWTVQTSTLSLAVTKVDNNAKIGCSIAQSYIMTSVVQTTPLLNVYYQPSVSGITPVVEQTYPEGTAEMEFKCLSEGNPTPDIKWIHDNGTVIEGSKLVLTNLKTEWTGNYHCVVNNSFNGVSYSDNKTYFINIVTTTTIPTTSTTKPPSTSEKEANLTKSVKDPEGLSDDNKTIIIVVVVLAVVVIGIIVGFVILIYRRRKAQIQEPSEKTGNNRDWTFYGNRPDLVMADEKPKNVSCNNDQYKNEDALNYAVLNLDDKPRSRKPVQMSETTPYAEVTMPSV